MKELKNILMLMVALLATTAFAACGDDDNGAGGGTPVSKLTVRPVELSFTADGGEQTIKAQAPVQATAP